MSASQHGHVIPLPRDWPQRVRSAVVHTIALAHLSLTHARSIASNSINARIRLKTENDRLRNEILLLREESRIKDARMAQIPAQRRPHYPPSERLAILELRAARGWSLSQTAARFLVTLLTIASWTKRLDEAGTDALIRMPEPANRFPDFVGYLVRRLKVLCPSMGKARIAHVLCRAGLHLGSTTIRRMIHKPVRPELSTPVDGSSPDRVVTARRPNHVSHADLTEVPTSLGFWASWAPFAIPQVWPFCWWVVVAVDHFSRRLLGAAIFTKEPTSLAVRRFFDRTIDAAGTAPAHLITDRGVQFTANAFRKWARRRHVHQRFGAVGQYGSIAIVERLIRTLKAEGTRRVLVSYRKAEFARELRLWRCWYNTERPHEALSGRTPDEVYFARRPASLAPRYEPRPRWPRPSRCAAPQVLIRGRPGAALELLLSYPEGRAHLPIVRLRRVA